jgi:serine/threonine protein kinase
MTFQLDMFSHITGGAFISSGVYGCVFRPALPCKDGGLIDPKHTSNISKISSMDRKYLDKEIAVGRRIRKVPIADHYFALARDGICEPPEAMLKKDTGVGECEMIYEDSGKKKYMIQQPFGGRDFQKTILGSYKPETVDFYKIGQRLLEGLVIMAVTGVVHTDLHRENILIDMNENPKIIDFGAAVIIGDPVKKLVREFDPQYGQIAPEMSLWDAWRDKLETTTAARRIATEKYSMSLLRIYTGDSVDVQVQKLTEYRMRSSYFKRGDFEAWWAVHWPKIDVWSLGFVLLTLWNRLSKYDGFAKNKVYIEKRRMILDVLRGMMEVNPMKRLNAVQALQKWAPTSVVLRRYAGKWVKGGGEGENEID